MSELKPKSPVRIQQLNEDEFVESENASENTADETIAEQEVTI